MKIVECKKCKRRYRCVDDGDILNCCDGLMTVLGIVKNVILNEGETIIDWLYRLSDKDFMENNNG